MKRIFTIWLILAQAAFIPLMGQNPCGTPAGKTDWLKQFQKSPAGSFALPEEDTIFYIPVTVHLVGNDDSTGFYSFENLMKSFCQLNEDFAQANIQFFLQEPIRYLPNSAYNVHSTVIEGAEMMFANDVPHTLNTYFVTDPAGNCGYNLPYASIAMAKACAGENHTWAHETGHAFQLPHPFLGWEGKVYNPDSITPVKVTYDYTYFQDTLILDTLIIDTAWVELVDGSNCHIAADGFCDTPPDYLSYRWNCNAQNQSSVLQKDPNGESFASDGTFFMSYSADQCQSKFSPEQITTMRAYVLNEHPDYIDDNQDPLPLLNPVKPTLITPVQNAVTNPDSTLLVWNDYGASAKYHLRVAKKLNMTDLIVDTVLTDTSFLLAGLQVNKNYFWKVQPFNRNSFCTPASNRGKFKTSPTAIIEPATATLIYPTLTRAGETIYIRAPFTGNQNRILLVDGTGRVILSENIMPRGEFYLLPLPANLPKGLYFVMGYSGEKNVLQAKISIY